MAYSASKNGVTLKTILKSFDVEQYIVKNAVYRHVNGKISQPVTVTEYVVLVLLKQLRAITIFQ